VIAEAMRAFIDETNRQNHERRANEAEDRLRLEKARRGIAGIVAAIEDGGYSRPLMDRLRTLETEVETIEQALAAKPRDIPDIHPNIAELYRRKVERLIDALNDPDDRVKAATALRAVIDRVVVSPSGKRGEVDVRLHGDLETLLAWAQDKSIAGARAHAMYSRAVGDAVSVPASAGSGDLVAGQARPPPAWSKAKGRVRLKARPLRPLGASGNGGTQVPLRPQQGHLTGRWRITTARSVRASSKRYQPYPTPDVVRRSASLSINSQLQARGR
jgi:hypothetical protein